MRYSRLVGWFKGWLAEAYLLKGDPAHAATEAQLGLEISRATGFTWAVGLAQRALGTIARRRGDLGDAEAKLSESLATFTVIQSRLDEGRSHLALAELLQAQAEPERAAEHVEAARERFAELGASTYLARLEPLGPR